MTLEPGIRGEQSVSVTAANTAKTMGSGTLDVFATPALVALAEKTCWMSVAPALAEGDGTVGTKLELEHTAPTPVGMAVRAEARLTEIKGKNGRITFNFRPDAAIDPLKIPAFLKKHGEELSFTAYGNPFFTYKYKKTGLVETDAELLMGKTEELLEEMKELVLEKIPAQEN